MEIQFTIKIRDEHNPPEFKEGMGKGVLQTQVAVYDTITEEEFKSSSFQGHVFSFGDELLHKLMEVKIEIVDPELVKNTNE